MRNLGRLDETNGRRFQQSCKVCGTPAQVFDAVDFNKYCDELRCYKFGFSNVNVTYHRCPNCGFLFTTCLDDWTEDDFRRFIYNDDYIKVDPEYAEIRPNHVGGDFARRLRGTESARILDFGSGAGGFAKKLRESGYTSVASYDPFSSPEQPTGQFDIITCFEVIEHTPDPLRTFDQMLGLLKDDGCIIVSQTLQPSNILSIRGSWWYLAPRNGHISTYTEECFEAIARRVGFYFYRGDTVYAFTGPNPSEHATIAAQSIGPSFSSVRLYAPTALHDRAIVGTDRTSIAWHVLETAGPDKFRWTGDYGILEWKAAWPAVTQVRFSVPLLRPVAEDFVANCVFTLNGISKPAALVRGALTAEFQTHDQRSGVVRLETPTPTRVPMEGNRAVGLAVPIERDWRDVTSEITSQ